MWWTRVSFQPDSCVYFTMRVLFQFSLRSNLFQILNFVFFFFFLPEIGRMFVKLQGKQESATGLRNDKWSWSCLIEYLFVSGLHVRSEPVDDICSPVLIYANLKYCKCSRNLYKFFKYTFSLCTFVWRGYNLLLLTLYYGITAFIYDIWAK